MPERAVVGMSTGLVALLAAAVAIAIAVVLVRTRNARSNEDAPPGARSGSADFEALRVAAGAGGKAGPLARRLLDTVDPFSFHLVQAQGEDDFGSLLEVLLTRSSLVTSEPVARGVGFDASRHVPEGPHLDAPMVVVRPSAYYAHRDGSVLLKAQNVAVCTADWWHAAVAHPDCPVAQLLAERAQAYTLAPPGEERRWTADEGFDPLARLRGEALSEADIQAWAVRLRDGLREAYVGQPDSQLIAHGAVGSDYASTSMSVEGGAPVGRARVTEVVAREGISQLGWGCPKCTPLVRAHVRVEEVL